MITVTKRFTFEAAHRLAAYKGPCAKMHGHSYKLYITVSGPTQVHADMVIDFKDLKTIVDKYIIDKLDHNMLNEIIPMKTTAENMVIWIGDMIEKHLPVGIILQRIRLYETEDSYAEWSL